MFLLNFCSRGVSVVAAAVSKHHPQLPNYTVNNNNTINYSCFHTPFSSLTSPLGLINTATTTPAAAVDHRRRFPTPLASSASSSSLATSTSSPAPMGNNAPDSGMDAVQRRLMFEDECILVDENDNVVGHDSKYNCHLMEKIESENLLHRAFSVFLFNSKYELLLQQRSATKVTFPLVWTNTCCSHPLYRESELIEENYLGVRNAAQRKLFDELGIPAEDVPVDQFTPLGRILYKAPSDGKWGEHELDYLLFIVRDVNVQPNPDEVADVKYVNRNQLKELVRKADAGEEGLKLSPWFRLVVDNFLLKWWDHVEKGTLHEAADMKTIHKLT
ncbi:PREDICTED: isopentenyl-diphosphate Delta-isomerase I [Nelumbo nucifera]|uniref:isopentenyl-diphosphate Delta-isomerase n=2 Tax=Nelumbo nucifera TaxID=4432 RepID=A0A822ZQ55_NELNU|nr:PREDICTED: isopentenyl-diphosphate Delta-isomerase I [Nelumbo nucifera]DAD43938.1 TPA_asm: hypothetical protein HUJ06_002168 [Nelumbo nucifera]